MIDGQLAAGSRSTACCAMSRNMPATYVAPEASKTATEGETVVGLGHVIVPVAPFESNILTSLPPVGATVTQAAFPDAARRPHAYDTARSANQASLPSALSCARPKVPLGAAPD